MKNKWQREREQEEKKRKSERRQLAELLRKAEAAATALSDALIDTERFKKISVEDKVRIHVAEARHRIRLARTAVRL